MSNNEKFLVGIDLGTTRVKAGIMTINGEMLGSGYYEYPCTYPKQGWVEQDVELLADSAINAIQDALEGSEVEVSKLPEYRFLHSDAALFFLMKTII